jgi:DNA replication protein DnaC
MNKKKNVSTETAMEHLRELQLGYFVEHFGEYAAEAARKQIGHVEYLDALAEGELAERMERRIARRVREAKIPVMRSLASFDWTHPTTINRQQVEMLARLDFLKDHANVVFIGPCGVGKSFLASCLLENACRKGISALFVQAVDIVNDLLAAQTAGRLSHAMRKYISPTLVCIDELGYLPLGKDGCNLLFQVFSKRYEQKSTIVTTNKPFKNWGEVFNGDSTAASAIIDRIVHHCEVVKIEGASYRMKDKIAK